MFFMPNSKLKVAAAALVSSLAVVNVAEATPTYSTDPNSGVTTKTDGTLVCSYTSPPLSTADAGLAGVSAATDCIQIDSGPGGNTTLTQMLGAEAFEIDSWSIADKIDVEKTTLGGFLEITLTDSTSGTWSLLSGLSFPTGESFALALKGSPASITYLLDPNFTAGTWSMRDITNSGGQMAGLSNITLFGTVAPIPLPAPVLMLMGAIGGLAFVTRRRLKAETA